MAAQNPPGWLQNAGATHTAAQLRMYLASLQAGMSGGATSLRARGGVHPGLGQELLVTQTGSPSMAVLLEPGVASVPGSLSGTQGNYFVVNDAQTTLSVTAAHATLPRIDIVVANVRDAFYSGSSNDCQLQVIAGTPASSPVAPTPPDNSITVAEIAVGAAVSTIVNANITDKRFYVAATGGFMNIRNIAAIPASTEINEGQPLWAMDSNIPYIWDGTNANKLPFWVDWTSYTPTWTSSGTAPSLGNGTITGRYMRIGNLVTVQLNLTMGSTTTFGTGVYFFSIPLTAESPISFNSCGTGWCLDTGVKECSVVAKLENGGTTFRLSPTYDSGGSFGNVGNTNPFTWANGDVLTAQVQFRPV